MDEKFKPYIQSLERAFRKLNESPLLAAQPLPLPPEGPAKSQKGIYVFCESGKPMYVGRSDNLRARIQNHCRPSSGHNSASFAFLLACEAKGRKSGPGCSRSELEKEPNFKQAFLDAKKRVRQMDLRFVEEEHPIRQALLEIYVAVALATPYNSFETH